MLARYPDTPEGDKAYQTDALIVIGQIVLTMLAYIIGTVIIKKSVKWARVINPILLTVAFALERPILPVYSDYFEVFSSCINMCTCYLIPWFVCETMAAQIISFIICYTALLV